MLDPLGRMALTLDGYRALTERMLRVAAEACGGRIVFTQEGGYAPHYAPYCTAAIVETVVGLAGGDGPPLADPYGERAVTMPPSRELGLDVGRALERATRLLGRYWAL